MPELTEQQKLQAEKDARNKERLLDQTEVNYTPVSMQMGKACAGCRWFEPAESWGDGEDRIPSCHLVYSWPQSIQPTGYCDRYEIVPVPQPFTQTPMPVVIVDPETLDIGTAELSDVAAQVEPGIVQRLINTLKNSLSSKESDGATAFKVVGNHWIASWSNNLEDRDGEIFTAKAIDDFVTRVDMGVTPLPELWVWHVPGSRIGQAEWVDRHGHFLMAMGTFDESPAGEKARTYYAKHSGSKSLSHGFTFPVNQFDGKHYHQFNTFEISLLPRGAEANLYTSLEGVKAMAKVISEAKKAELFAAFGEEVGARILAAEDAKGKALDELGVASKDFVAVNENDGAANKQAVANADKAFAALVPDLMEGSAEAVIAATEAVNVAKKAVADVALMRKELTAGLAEVKAIRDGAPRASQSAKTIVKEDDTLAKKSQAGLTPEQEALSEALPGLYKQG